MLQLTIGARGPEVAHLQRLLNWDNFQNGFPSPDITVDQAFGPRTQTRLIAWQRANGVNPTGTADPRTWHDLGQLTEIDHNVTLFGQPTSQSCWSAAATMLFGNMSVGQGRALFTPGTHLLEANLDNVRTFLQGAGLRFLPPAASLPALVTALRRGPIWAAGKWHGGGQRGGHVVVISAVWADQTQNQGATTLRIHDPWPVGRGAVYAGTYERNTLNAVVRSGTTFNDGIIAMAQR